MGFEGKMFPLEMLLHLGILYDFATIPRVPRKGLFGQWLRHTCPRLPTPRPPPTGITTTSVIVPASAHVLGTAASTLLSVNSISPHSSP